MFTDIALPLPCSRSHWEIFTKEKSALAFLQNSTLRTWISGALFGYKEVLVPLDHFGLFLQDNANKKSQ